MGLLAFLIPLSVAIAYSPTPYKQAAAFGGWCFFIVLFELTDRHFAEKRRKTLQDWRLPAEDREPESNQSKD
jgi:hypothetical protein